MHHKDSIVLCTYVLRLMDEQHASDILKAQKKSLQDTVKDVERKHQVCMYVWSLLLHNRTVITRAWINDQPLAIHFLVFGQTV